MNSKKRSYLIKHAHKLKPVVMLGKLGLTEAVLAAADEALNAHELIKLKFQDHKEDRHALSAELSEKLNAETVAVLGNIAVLFRRKKEESAFKKVF